MKIISRKKYEKINQQMVDLQMDLNQALDDEKKYLKQVNYLQNEIEKEKKVSNDFSKVIEEDFVIIEGQKDTIKKLKTLLTKNKIDYKSLLDKESKNVKTTNKERKTTKKTK